MAADRLVCCAVMELGQQQNPTMRLWSPHIFPSRAIRSNESAQNSSHLFSELIIQSTTKKMFAIVQFVGGNFMEAVPLSWLRENEMMCLWPPHRFPNRAIRSCEPPQANRPKIAGRLLLQRFSTEQVNLPSIKTSVPLSWLRESSPHLSVWTKWIDECEIREKAKLCRCKSQGDE